MIFLETEIYLSALGVLCVVMALAWYFLGRWNCRGHVDLLWALAIAVQAVYFCFLSAGWLPRRIIVGGLAVLWATRLASHLFRRLNRDGEDGRYMAMEKAAGDRAPQFFFVFFQAQAFFAWMFAIPFGALAQNSESVWSMWEILALFVWCLAWIGNCVADRQLDLWRRSAFNQGRTCRLGLWAWSRHPNYFFEWLMWLAYAIAAIGTPSMWVLIGISLLMLLMVTKVTGIPFTEKQAIRSRGEDYLDYQKTTSSFFPLPPRRVSNH